MAGGLWSGDIEFLSWILKVLDSLLLFYKTYIL